MKKTKSKETANCKNSKISDFFAKLPSAQKPTNGTNGKRKDFATSNTVLHTVTNLPEKNYENGLSPDKKKIKHENNVFASGDCTDNYEVKLVKTEFLLQPPCSTFNSLETQGPSTQCTTPSPKRKENFVTPSRRRNTPQSFKKSTTKSPKRLFEKSPRKLEEFNVQVLENFVRISPSTSNPTMKRKVTPHKKDHKNQGSATPSRMMSLNFESAEKQNEVTPLKTVSVFNNSSSTSSCVRTKLNFTECNEQPKKEESVNFDEDLGDLLGGFSENDFNALELGSLNYEEPRFCRILEIEQINNAVILKVQSLNDHQKGTCRVKGFWASSSNLCVGDIICIQTSFNTNNEGLVDNENGWLILEPHLLISCTTVLGSMFCKRKSVLMSKFQIFGISNRIMLIGQLVHKIFQNALKKNLRTFNAIEDVMKSELSANDTVRKLYETNISTAEIEVELVSFIPKIVDFIIDYLNNGDIVYHNKKKWNGTILQVDDIEENLWCPQLGIKGKIDVTAQTNSGIMPLELKTGKSSISMQHRGQVVLYIMMMNKFGYSISSGLLLYLKEGLMREIEPSPQEMRDILILRNELAYCFSRKHKDKSNTLQPPLLPEPLLNNRACSSCEFNTICTSFLKYENYDISKNTKLEKVQTDVTSHLTQDHLNYFLHWFNLLNLEVEDTKSKKALHEIFTVPAAKREQQGRCISSVLIVRTGSELNGLTEHIFEKFNVNGAINLNNCGIMEGSYVIISTEKRPAVATGFVTTLSFSSISISLDRNLFTKFKRQIFHIDTYDSNNTLIFNSSNLSIFLEKSNKAERLRSIIIDKNSPTFLPKLPAVVARKCVPILKRLNIVQQRAVLKAISAKDFLLIKGMPGTGKSATIVALVQLLVQLDKTVLITSHTHSAVDNICIRLKKINVDFIRLGSESKIDSDIKEYSEANLTKESKTVEDYEKVFNSYKVAAVTCLGSGHPLLSQRTFDVCLIDESTQVLQTSLIRSLYAANTFILIGDPNQLAPTIKSPKAKQLGMEETLFERLSNSSIDAVITLNLNYRMNKTITELANILTYGGELQTANDIVANRCIQIPNVKSLKKKYHHHSWLLQVLTPSLEDAVQFIDTGPVWTQPTTGPWSKKFSQMTQGFESDSLTNMHEAAIVKMLVHALIEGGVAADDIGVMATYRAQVSQISAILENTGINISTVDQFQGRDKNIIIYSCTKSSDMNKNTPQKYELLEDNRRLTVAVTRAKRKLILIGDLSTLQNYTTFSKILHVLKQKLIKVDVSCDILRDL